MFELETVEGYTVHVNPVHVTYVMIDERNGGLTRVGLACSTVYRTNWPVAKVLKEISGAFEEMI